MSTDTDLILFLAGGVGGGCSLDSSPKKNWVENGGGLPSYICKIAKAVMRSGKSKSSAIAIAVSRVKKWATGGDDVDADTRAKAAKAVAEWEALKAKHASKKLVKASREDGSEYLMLSNIPSFNVDNVRRAWNELQDTLRRKRREEAKANGVDVWEHPEVAPYSYIREMWTDHIIVEMESPSPGKLAKISYSVSGQTVTFSDPVEVVQEYVEVEEYDDELSEFEAALLGDVMILSRSGSALEHIMALAKKG